MLAKAREQTGIIDIIDSEPEEALNHLLASLNTQAGLSEGGAVAMEDRLLNLLRNRLRMKRDFRAHPEIDRQQIVRPVIISGLPRTGSTKVHKMLVASGDFKYQNFWQGYSLSLRSGNRDEDPAPRIDEADRQVRWFNTQAPMAASIHEFSTFEPEEESLVYEHYIGSNYQQAFSFVPDFLQWQAAQDPAAPIRFIRQGLKYLQWQFYDGDPRPWILKCPMYPGFEAILAEVFDGATIVCTHRRPHDVISSGASLLHYYHKAHSDADRKQLYGQIMFEGMAMGLENYLNVRDAHPALNILDVSYTDITKNGGLSMEKIYAKANMALSDKARQAMHQWELDNSQHKLGLHKHSLEEFGITAAMVNTKYARYIERYGSYF